MRDCPCELGIVPNFFARFPYRFPYIEIPVCFIGSFSPGEKKNQACKDGSLLT